MIWHQVGMPDDDHLPMPRRDPEDIDLGAIKADLEFLIERSERRSESEGRVGTASVREEKSALILYASTIDKGLAVPSNFPGPWAEDNGQGCRY
jgi:hypothetical protein